jgi:hypothetical protein
MGGLAAKPPMHMKLSGFPLCKAGDWGLQTLNGCHLWVREGTRSLTLPILVGFVGF